MVSIDIQPVTGFVNFRGVYQCEMTEMKRVETFLLKIPVMIRQYYKLHIKRVIVRFSRLKSL